MIKKIKKRDSYASQISRREKRNDWSCGEKILNAQEMTTKYLATGSNSKMLFDCF